MLSVLSQILSFALSVVIIAKTAEGVLTRTGSRFIAIAGGILAGIAISVILDFTLAYATPEYERDLESVISRAVSSIVLSLILSFVVTMKSFRHE
jgi:hypothetical protein